MGAIALIFGEYLQRPSRGFEMRKYIVIALFVISTGAFADEQKKQVNVYDDFRQLGNLSAEVTVDEEVTAQIKRYMANLLYPVDMSSLNRPDKDAKFRDLIIILQQQMGVSRRRSQNGICFRQWFIRSNRSSTTLGAGVGPLWVISGHDGANLRCLLYPRYRTSLSAITMSAL
jgi:hypothetical protein